MVDRLGWQCRFSRAPDRRRMLFLTLRSLIPDAQVFPFWYHRRDLQSRYGIEMREVPLDARSRWERMAGEQVDAVCFQTSFDMDRDAMLQLVAAIRASFPRARLAYLDWFAPTDLRFAAVLEGAVDVYGKKHLFRDRSLYGRPTQGDTNLTDFYGRKFAIEQPIRMFPVPARFWDKLWLAPHFAFSPEILERLLADFPERQREIDIHARITVQHGNRTEPGVDWYSAMRQDALDRACSLEGRFRVRCRGKVPRREFFRELLASKMCFSPFGYGEVCWRDFEAMCTGALLLKPDMAHIQCSPASFEPYKTYVPLEWDLSDFVDKASYYLEHEDQREAIARRAFDHLKSYFQRGAFLVDIIPFLRKLELISETDDARAEPSMSAHRAG